VIDILFYLLKQFFLNNYFFNNTWKKYEGGAVRMISVYYSGLVDESLTYISLFDDVDCLEKEERLQSAIDTIRNQFGFSLLQKGTSLLEASRSLERSRLIGGHSAGGLDGLR
jgi:DNA polymerase V